jgi:hypothetical protein
MAAGGSGFAGMVPVAMQQNNDNWQYNRARIQSINRLYK